MRVRVQAGELELELELGLGLKCSALKGTRGGEQLQLLYTHLAMHLRFDFLIMYKADRAMLVSAQGGGSKAQGEAESGSKI